jgi:RNA polymerase sigma-70 factor (ECF subfamily)
VTSEAPALRDLLAAIASGDPMAFDRLHRETNRTVVAAIRRVLRDPWQSDEVAQEVFLEVWQKAAQYDSRLGTAHGWILTLAHRRAIDRVRAAQASRDRDLRSAARNVDRPQDQVWDRVESLYDAAELHRALLRLTPLQREALTSTYLHGRSVAEAAGHLGASEKALRTRMRDGLIGLRRMIPPIDAAA